MADFAQRPPHSSSTTKKTLSNGNIYNDVFGGSSKFGISRVDDYTEIFTSRSSSIPFLDLPSVDDETTSAEISSVFDYSEIFGGFDFENYAVPYQELFLESSNTEENDKENDRVSSSSSEDVWTPAGSVSLSEESFENPLTSESTQAFSNTDSHYGYDGVEEFNVSYHKANQIGKEDSISGTTRIAQLNAVPAYTLVVDENASLHTTKFEEVLPEVSKKHNLNELTNDSRMDDEHYWEAMPPQPASESTQNPEKNLDENKIYKKKPFMTVSEINLRTQPLEVPPPSRLPPKLSKQGSHKIMTSDFKPSAKYPRQGVANDSSPPFFDVEVDSTSSAAASAAAMKEAMEKAQATLKSAREMMGGLQRKKMGVRESSKLNEERPHIENGRMHGELKGFDKEERQKGIGTAHVANELKLKPRAVNAASVSVDRSHLKQPELSHEFLQREIIGEWKAEEQFYELVKKDTVETVLVASKNKKSERNVIPSPRLFDQDENENKAGNAAFVQQEKSNGKPQAAKKACESKEDEKRVNVSMEACERVEDEKVKAAEMIHDQEKLQREERERQLNETLEREEAEKKLKAAHAMEENEKRRRDALQREEIERREREVNERREREAFEREAFERREREAFEREEKERREREALEREETEKREKEEYERKEKEKRLKEAREREENERKLKEVERRLIEVREKEENERRLKEAHEREEQERKLKEAERRLIEVLEQEEKERKLKEAHDREERERIMKEVREREENETRLREIREKEENERRLKEQLEREEIQRKLVQAAEEEKKLRQARESEENEKRLKEALEREENEKRLIEARKREENERILQEAREREENEKRLRDQLEREEHERRLKEELEIEENRRKLAQAAEEKERLLKEAHEREETERRRKEEHQREENERRVRECQKKEENEKKLKQAAEENERRLKEVQIQEETENIRKESSEEVAEKLLLQETFVKVKSEDNVAAPKAKVDNSDKKTEITEIAVREEKDRQQKKESNTSQMLGPSTNNGMKRDQEKEETVKEKEQEKERLKKLEEEKQREREREKDRIAVESVTREAHERAFAEARERAERAAVERATTEARQRAMVEARERLEKACAEAREKSLAEKAYAEAQARLRSERAAVERATAEARERAEKAMREKALRDRVERSVSEKFSTTSRDSVLRHNASFSNIRDAQFQNSTSSFTGSKRYSDKSQGTECDSVQRCKAKLEREQRTVERAAKALAEKNSRDYLAQREQMERNRLAETLDADVKRWSNGKEGNLRALLSTLQYILGADSGWQPVPLTDVVTAVAVKKAYRKATLCVHPDKVQQRGANIQQKYVCEKVFDLLKDAWTKFNSEER